MIRTATLSDIDALAQIDYDCFGPVAWSRELVAAELAAPSRDVLVADEQGAPIGYASIMTTGESADLQRIAVIAEQRRHGHARLMLAALFERAEQRGARRILLEVAETNDAALYLYDSMGFSVISRRKRYYADGSDALVLSNS